MNLGSASCSRLSGLDRYGCSIGRVAEGGCDSNRREAQPNGIVLQATPALLNRWSYRPRWAGVSSRPPTARRVMRDRRATYPEISTHHVRAHFAQTPHIFLT